ncbi:MAG: hypothetical protein GY842_13700 [bacterium]|nr:hypothetical protein [bacterium]
MKKPLHRFLSFHRDDSAQIAFIMVFGAVAFVALLGLVVTTGDQASSKIQAQNAADAAALSGGAWIARGLNLTSAINVMQTQLVGGAILLNAFSETLRISIPIVQAMCVGYTACSATVLGCIVCCIPEVITCAQAAVLPIVSNAFGSLASSLAKCPGGFFWFAAKILEYVNEMIRYWFFLVAFIEANDVALANRADAALLLPGPVFHAAFSLSNLFLPTKKGHFTDLCSPMTVGSPTRDERGYFKLLAYPVGQGPYNLGKCRLWWATTMITGIPPVGWVLFPTLADMQHGMLCGGDSWGSSTVEITRQAKSLAECEALGGFADWTRTSITTELMASTDACGWFSGNFTREHPPDGSHPEIASMTTEEIKRRSCSWRPPGKKLDEGEYCHLTGSTPVKVSDDPERWEYHHTLDIWALGRTEVTEEMEIDVNPMGGSCGDKPNPYLLADDQDALRFLVLARRTNRRIFFSELFLEDPPDLYTYAQVEVYNGISHDTFTQDWRVRLVRASLLERPFQALDESRFMEIGNHILTGFGLDPWEFAEAFHEINNH